MSGANICDIYPGHSRSQNILKMFFFVGCLQVDDLSEGCHVRAKHFLTKLFSFFFFSNKVGLLETHFTSDHPLSVFPAEGAKLSKELRREENADDRSWSFVSPKFKACLRIDFQM